MDSKPWLSAPIDNRRWVASFNHRGKKVSPSDVEGIVLIQDANMGGAYVRVIQWCPAIDKQTRFAVYAPGEPQHSHDDWYFEESISTIQDGDKIENRDGTCFHVVKSEGRFVRILERAPRRSMTD